MGRGGGTSRCGTRRGAGSGGRPGTGSGATNPIRGARAPRLCRAAAGGLSLADRATLRAERAAAAGRGGPPRVSGSGRSRPGHLGAGARVQRSRSLCRSWEGGCRRVRGGPARPGPGAGCRAGQSSRSVGAWAASWRGITPIHDGAPRLDVVNSAIYDVSGAGDRRAAWRFPAGRLAQEGDGEAGSIHVLPRTWTGPWKPWREAARRWAPTGG